MQKFKKKWQTFGVLRKFLMSKFYNTINDVFIEAILKRIDTSELNFRDMPETSYRELSTPILNQIDFQKDITMNSFINFEYLSSANFNKEMSNELFEILLNVCINYQIYLDFKENVNFESIIAQKMLENIESGNYGKSILRDIEIVKENDMTLALFFAKHYFYNLNNGFSYDRIEKVFYQFFKYGKIYVSKKSNEIILFLNKKRSKLIDSQISILTHFFFPISHTINKTICYENHFGIIGSDEFMKIGEICII